MDSYSTRWWINACAFVAGLLCCACPLRLLAQYRFDHWTADNGLPQNSMCDVVQTRDGYVWLTTFDGLVRFDGVRFTVFNRANTPMLIMPGAGEIACA